MTAQETFPVSLSLSAALITSMAAYEVEGTHTIISLAPVYMYVYIIMYMHRNVCAHPYSCMHLLISFFFFDSFILSLIKRLPRGRRYLGEDELVTDTQLWQEQKQFTLPSMSGTGFKTA